MFSFYCWISSSINLEAPQYNLNMHLTCTFYGKVDMKTTQLFIHKLIESIKRLFYWFPCIKGHICHLYFDSMITYLSYPSIIIIKHFMLNSNQCIIVCIHNHIIIKHLTFTYVNTSMHVLMLTYSSQDLEEAVEALDPEMITVPSLRITQCVFMR